ncbi:MAG: hypothetical protein ACYTBS_26700 [Planctomycetota bacterium]|jgi:hypothetical protein
MPLGEPQTVEVVPMLAASLPVQNRSAVLQFYMTASELARAIRGTNGRLDEVLSQLAEIKRALKQSPRGGEELLEQARRLELKLKDIRESLTGGTVLSRYNEPDRISVANRVNSAMSGAGSTYGPTKTQRADYQIAKEQFEAELGQVKRLIEGDFVNLQRNLDAAGVPWTSGRPIPQLKE